MSIRILSEIWFESRITFPRVDISQVSSFPYREWFRKLWVPPLPLEAELRTGASRKAGAPKQDGPGNDSSVGEVNQICCR